MTLPHGVRLKNPLNIERDGTQWEGAAPVQNDPVFVEFQTEAFGFRAGFRNLIAYVDKHGLKTVRGILSRHSPAGGDNITASDPDGTKQLNGYIDAVCKRTGFSPDEELSPKTWADGSKLIYAMTEHEQGGFDAYFTAAQLAEGAYRAGIADAPRSPIKKIGVVLSGAAAAASSAAPSVVDAINTYKPVVDQSNSATLKTVFGVLAVGFAILTIINHVRSSK